MKPKICSKCGVNQVTKTRKNRNGSLSYQSYCNPCNAAYQRGWRQTESGADSSNRRRRKVARYLRRVKYRWGCAYCSLQDPDVLDFDHIDPSTKSLEVSKMKNYSMDRVKAELRKCQVLCKNCHTLKTKRDRK